MLEKMMSLLTRAMPNPDQIEWISITTGEIRFTWRGADFRVATETGFIEEIEGQLLVGSDKASLIEQLLKKQRLMEDSHGKAYPNAYAKV